MSLQALSLEGDLRIETDGVPLRVRARGDTVSISPERLRDALRIFRLRRTAAEIGSTLSPWLTRAGVIAEVRILGLRVASFGRPPARAVGAGPRQGSLSSPTRP